MCAADYPHAQAILPHTREAIEARLAGVEISEPEKQDISSDDATRLFGFERPAAA